MRVREGVGVMRGGVVGRCGGPCARRRSGGRVGGNNKAVVEQHRNGVAVGICRGKVLSAVSIEISHHNREEEAALRKIIYRGLESTVPVAHQDGYGVINV